MGQVLGRPLGVVLAAVFLQTPAGAMAQPVADFYRGKTVSLILGYPGGGSNGIYARAVARNIGRHIPGNPTVIFRSMPGAGSLVAANHLFNVAPKDGTALGFISATIPLEELLGVAGVKFKSAEFNWIGRIASGVNMTFVKGTSPAKSIQDVYKREVILGASGRSSTVFVYPAVLGAVTGAKFKMVLGYASSPEAMLAMERGEVEGHSTSLEVVRALHPTWLSEKRITVLVQYALNRHPELPDVPMSWELGRSPEDQQILKVVANATEIGKMILAPPGLPAERVEALRRAFDATMKDPDFVAELNSNRVELGVMAGEDLQKLVADLGATPPAMVDKIKMVYPLN
jgi:tripartite-type tricarboxylate transporter receptor subunit TctC